MITRFKKESPILQGRILAEQRIRENDTTGVHFHDYFEIEYIVAADATTYIDGKKYDCQPGLIYFLTPINTHNLITKNITLIHLGFTASNCDINLLSQLVSVSKNTIFNLPPEEQEFVLPMLTEMVRHNNNNAYLSILLDALLSKLILLHSTSSNRDEPKFSAARNAILYIISSFKKNISLNDTASYVGLTPTYFSTLFKSEVGLSFKEYLDNVRFDHAQNMILYSDSNMHEICLASGFSNYENFVRRFKERFGYSPREYKSKYKNV